MERILALQNGQIPASRSSFFVQSCISQVQGGKGQNMHTSQQACPQLNLSCRGSDMHTRHSPSQSSFLAFSFSRPAGATRSLMESSRAFLQSRSNSESLPLSESPLPKNLKWPEVNMNTLGDLLGSSSVSLPVLLVSENSSPLREEDMFEIPRSRRLALEGWFSQLQW